MRIASHMAPLVLASVLLALPAAAKQNGNNGNGNGQGQGKSQSGKSGGNNGQAGELHYAKISRHEARKWAEPFRIEGYKPLPPGIRKNLARGKPIPPGLAYRTLPPAYIAQLPRYPGYEWRGYGSDLVLVAVATAVIADVILDVFD